MKTFYAVTTTFDNRGRVTAAITDTQKADSQPERTFITDAKKDTYVDWFPSQSQAAKFVREAKKA